MFAVDLGLQRNQLTGTFPPEVDSLQVLRSLDLSGNLLRGDLPEVFSRLHGLSKDACSRGQTWRAGLFCSHSPFTFLGSLDLSDNEFKLNLPTSLGLLNRLGKDT